MSESPKSEAERALVDYEAAAWVLRSDHGLTASEQDAFSEWLAADPKRLAIVSCHRRNWDRLDQLAEKRPDGGLPDPNLLEASQKRISWVLPLLLAAAAAIAVCVFVRWPHRNGSVVQISSPAVVAKVEVRKLADGSTIQLNGDTAVTVSFTSGERCVSLDRGEAHFTVSKNPARPFIVNAGGVRIKAVGTAFDVRLESSKVTVLVTEGRVQVDQASSERTPEHAIISHEGPAFVPRVPVLNAGQRALLSLSLDGPPLQVVSVSAEEMTRLLSWRPHLLDFTSVQLSEVIAEFNRRNVVQLKIADPALAAFRISASFRSDNVDGFVRLLESSFGVQAERLGTDEIILSKARR